MTSLLLILQSNFMQRTISAIIIIMILMPFLILGGILYSILICFIVASLMMEAIKIMQNKESNAIHWYSLIILALFNSFLMIQLRYDIGNHWQLILWYIIVICSTDIAAYIFGSILRGPKILPNISPKKTWSGAILGTISAILMGYSYYMIVLYNVIYIPHLIYYLTFLSLAGQMGDFTISYCKRTAKIKDSGNCVPGHGGIIDRLDSILFSFPFFFYIIQNSSAILL